MSVSVTQQKQFIGGDFVDSTSGETMLGQLYQNDPTMFSNPDYEKKWLAVQGK